MPNRIIKETICTSENVDSLSAFQETFFYRLIVCCDDFGRMDARPRILASRLFPLRDIRDTQISDALRALTSAELVELYKVGGRPFLQMKTWDRHQQIRAAKSKYPGPDKADEDNCNQMISNDINCNQMISNVPVIQSNPIQYESNPNPERARARASNAAQVRPATAIPTEKEVFDFCTRRGYHFDVIKFYRNYFAQGRPCPDWQQKAEKWEKTERPAKPNQIHGSAGYGPTEADMEGMRKFIESMGGEEK